MTTTLVGAIGVGEAIINVSAAAPNAEQAQIDAEIVDILSGAPTTIWTVRRGAAGTVRSAHADGATVSPLVAVVQTGAPVDPPAAAQNTVSGSNIGTATPAASAPGDAGAAGTGPDYAAIDHQHPRETPGAVIAAVAGTAPAGGTGAAAGAWDTSGDRDTAIATINEIKAQLNALIAELKASGYIASS